MGIMKLNSSQLASWIKTTGKNMRYFLVYGIDSDQVFNTHKDLIKLIHSNKCELLIRSFKFKDVKDDPALLNDELASVSLFEEEKIIVIEDCATTISKDIIAILEKCKTATKVIFLATDLKPNSTLRKTFETEDIFASIACYKEDPVQIQGYIRTLLTELGFTFEADVPAIIAEILPANRMLIKNEIEKLSLFKGDDGHISSTDVEQITCEMSELSLDELCMAVSSLNSKAIVKIVNKFAKEETNFMLIIRVLLKHFARILEIKAMTENGKSIEQAIASLRPPVFFKQKDNITKAAKILAVPKLKRLYRGLIKLELDCKSGIIDPDLLTSNFLVSLEQKQ